MTFIAKHINMKGQCLFKWINEKLDSVIHYHSFLAYQVF